MVELFNCRACGRGAGVFDFAPEVAYHVSLRFIALHRLSGYVSLRRDFCENRCG